VTASGKNSTHFITVQECDSCHNTENWQVLQFVHQSMGYPGDHRQRLDCTACHGSNSEVVSWSSPAYQPDCAGCHASDYERDEHENASVSSLRDCSGTCHKSTPEHRVSDSDWD